MLTHLGYSDQGLLVNALHDTTSWREHEEILRNVRRIGRELGIDKTLKDNDIDVILGPVDSGPSLFASASGERDTMWSSAVLILGIQDIQLRHYHFHIWTITEDLLGFLL